MSALVPSSGFSSSCHMRSQGWLLFPKQTLFLGLDEGAPQADGQGLGDFLGSQSWREAAPPPSTVWTDLDTAL